MGDTCLLEFVAPSSWTKTAKEGDLPSISSLRRFDSTSSSQSIGTPRLHYPSLLITSYLQDQTQDRVAIRRSHPSVARLPREYRAQRSVAVGNRNRGSRRNRSQ